jgi:hypothetical protein
VKSDLEVVIESYIIVFMLLLSVTYIYRNGYSVAR